jgi:putative (di)nucleoside polyphosphate hydrolase
MKLDVGDFPYREGVIGIVRDDDGRFLVVQMVQYKKNEWRFPGGGVHAGESTKEALVREFKEELGTDKFEILKESQYINQYDWDEQAVLKRYNKDGSKYRGQRQYQYLVRFTGESDEIVPDPNELRQIRWVQREELSILFIFPGQWKQIKRVLEEFKV